MTLAAEHACTVTLAPIPTTTPDPWTDPARRLARVHAACACGTWLAEGTVNTAAPAYSPDDLPTRLRVMHRAHQTDVIADGGAAVEAEWNTALATLTAPGEAAS